ncbi:hypothetical protein AB6A40_010130 [Gnathostoma spinigerum]|uniref:Uncharacterized protein n=1 Tax=Gnathostoma spinigerum TaxID=75299 RepID=A0ABD6EU89_9BILA
MKFGCSETSKKISYLLHVDNCSYSCSDAEARVLNEFFCLSHLRRIFGADRFDVAFEFQPSLFVSLLDEHVVFEVITDILLKVTYASIIYKEIYCITECDVIKWNKTIVHHYAI